MSHRCGSAAQSPRFADHVILIYCILNIYIYITITYYRILCCGPETFGVLRMKHSSPLSTQSPERLAAPNLARLSKPPISDRPGTCARPTCGDSLWGVHQGTKAKKKQLLASTNYIKRRHLFSQCFRGDPLGLRGLWTDNHRSPVCRSSHPFEPSSLTPANGWWPGAARTP